MIRPACPKDRPVLERLYRTCFSETADYTAFAFEQLFSRADVPVAEVDGVPRSMCFLLPFVFRLGGRAVRAQYLYAACTDKAYRGRGLMGEILRTADNWCRRADRAFTFLVPASESLFSYYAAHGYRTVFTRAKVLPGAAQGALSPICSDGAYRRLRERYLSGDGCMIQSGWSMSFTAQDARLTDGTLYTLQLPHGPGCAVRSGSTVKELCCDRRDLSCAAGLFAADGVQDVYTSPFLSSGERIPYAMAKAPEGDALPFSQGYCNLLFD